MSARDRQLIARASKGDVDAFSRLVRAYSDLVYRGAARMVGSEDAQDAAQEVWVRVWANIKSFRGESAFSTWLYRITVNTCLSVQRKESRREEVRVALGSVREDHRAALVLRHMDGLSYAEIAEVLDVPDGTAKGWVSRGRAAMLVTLTQDGRDPRLLRPSLSV